MQEYNQIYRKDKNVWTNSLSPNLQLIFKNVKSGASFLDLGCGQGRDTLFLVKNGFKVVAVDSSELAVQQIQETVQNEKLKDIKVVQSNVVDFKIKNNKFDIINCQNVLQFLPKDEALKLIKKMQKKIKAHGFIAIASFTIDDPSYKLPKNKTEIVTHFELQEMLKLFRKFRIIFYFENTIMDKGHGGSPQPHQHGVVRIVAQKP